RSQLISRHAILFSDHEITKQRRNGHDIIRPCQVIYSNLFDSGIQPPIEPVVFKGQMLFFTRASVSFVRAVQAYFSSGAIAGKKLFPAFKLVKRLLIMLKPMYL